jgi:carbon storage regulator
MALVLQRQLRESIIIGDDIEIQIASINGNKVKLYIDAPPDVAVNRKEVFQRIQKEKELELSTPLMVKVTRKFKFLPKKRA